MEQCLAEEVAFSLATGRLFGAEAAAAHAHVDACEKCRLWVSELARAEAASAPIPADAPSTWSPDATTAAEASGAIEEIALAAGQTLGAYEIRRHVGSGGMSFVYAAFDRFLGRTIALKVLRPRLATPHMKARLLREAQAMARLAHPNVLPVYEAREIDGTLCIAMELVEGATLGRWLAAERRHWREVLRMFRQAAQGLAAAHAAGIVHRDFKPDNVLVGIDGRVRVSDFGLARWSSGAPAGDLSITQSGTFVGTPVYMSPEHAMGGDVDVDERSDQFSFCIALYEGLAGRRPFSGANVRELAHAMHSGTFDPPAPGRGIPRWLEQILLKGLSPKRGDRFASMQALLEALAAGERASDRRRAAVAFGAAAAAAALVVLAISQLRAHPPPHPVAAVAAVPPAPASASPSLPAPAPASAPTVAPTPVGDPAPALVKPSPRAAPARKKGLALDSKSPYGP
jgi:hypothetical protein